jgi:hypothetical protein
VIGFSGSNQSSFSSGLHLCSYVHMCLFKFANRLNTVLLVKITLPFGFVLQIEKDLTNIYIHIYHYINVN